MLNLNTNIKLNNNVEMPVLGFGTYTIKDPTPIQWAIEAGYRLIDTATIYENEEVVGEAIKKSKVPRGELFITTKLMPADMDNPGKALDESLKKLGTDYIDLWLIHWPEPGKRIAAWKAMEELYKKGKCRAIGVSNFTLKHLKELLETAKVIPTVNQVEFHVYLYQKELLEFCKSKGIQLESYMSLTRGRSGFDNESIKKIAEKYSKSVAQIMLRWVLQHGLIAIPKSAHQERIIENKNIFDFFLSEEDMNILNSLNQDHHYCSWDPTGKP